MPERNLRRLLGGGDRGSIAHSKTVLRMVHAAPERVAELAALASDPDWLVSMRALDLLGKIAHEHPEWVQPHKGLLIGSLADSEPWEIRLQIVRALPLLIWTLHERTRVVDILLRDINHPQTFVRTWALDSLAKLAETDARLMPHVNRALEACDVSASRALRARARHLRTRLRTFHVSLELPVEHPRRHPGISGSSDEIV